MTAGPEAVGPNSDGRAPSEGSAVSVPLDLSRLSTLSERPPLRRYLEQVWKRREFTLALAVSRLRAENSQDVLGSAWQVLNPLLLAGVYFLVFGTLLQTDRGIENFVAYLVIGVLVFTVCTRSAQAGADSLLKGRNMLQALHFPQAVLPIAAVLVVTASLVPAVAVMTAVSLGTGEPLRLTWLLVVPALLLQLGFNLGVGLLLARLTSRLHDIRRALPFLLRAWLYVSGVFYSIDRFVDHTTLRLVLEANPAYVYMTLVRAAFMESIEAPPSTWAVGAAWSFALLLLGVLAIWRGEGGEKPGDD